MEKNSRTGMAMWIVEDISNSSGRRVYIDPDISRMEAVRATIETWKQP